MPFIVTTKRPATKPVRKGRIPGRIGSGRMQAGRSEVVLSRHAVATLEEAKTESRKIVRPFVQEMGNVNFQTTADRALVQIEALTESGGSIGPLPDGTVIEIEAATWVDLTKTLHPDWMQQAEFGLPGAARAILAAWNAEQLEAFNAREAER